MQFLKFIAAVVGIPVVAVLLLVIMALAFIIAYVAWLVGVPVKVKIDGINYRYRWVKRVGSAY